MTIELVAESQQLQDGFSITLQRLVDVRDVEDAEEPVATEYAYKTTYSLLMEANRRAKIFPRATVVTTSEGGIRVRWNHLVREVLLSIPPSSDKDSYMYRECGEASRLEKNLSVENLVAWLKWLLEA